MMLWRQSGRQRVPQPDILVPADGRNVAVRGPDGRLHVMQATKAPRTASWIREWLAADTDARTGDDATLGEGVSCDEKGCVAANGQGALVALGAAA